MSEVRSAVAGACEAMRRVKPLEGEEMALGSNRSGGTEDDGCVVNDGVNVEKNSFQISRSIILCSSAR